MGALRTMLVSGPPLQRLAAAAGHPIRIAFKISALVHSRAAQAACHSAPPPPAAACQLLPVPACLPAAAAGVHRRGRRDGHTDGLPQRLQAAGVRPGQRNW